MLPRFGVPLLALVTLVPLVACSSSDPELPLQPEGGRKCIKLAQGEICISSPSVSGAAGGSAGADSGGGDGGKGDEGPTGGKAGGGSASGGTGGVGAGGKSSSGGKPGSGGAEETGGSTSGGSDGTGASGGMPPGPHTCLTFNGVLRDFHKGNAQGGHPDFERFVGNGELGLLEGQLDSDGLPVLAKAKPETIESAATFSSWYRNVDGTNAWYPISVRMVSTSAGLVFGSEDFFPLDDLGFGNEGMDHNFSFTTELHSVLYYDEDVAATFRFQGDDDLWVFIDGQLVLDLGGVRSGGAGSFDLQVEAERIGLKSGKSYSFDLFHAERHSNGSTFLVSTTLQLTGCDSADP